MLLLVPFLCEAQENRQAQKDSLRQVIATQYGVEKLDSYRLLTSYLFQEATLEELIIFFNEFEAVILQEKKKETNKQHLPHYIFTYANMKLNYGYALFNYGDFEGAEQQARNAMVYCSENKEWDIYYELYDLLLDVLTVSQKYEAVQRETKNLYKEAKKQNHPVGMTSARAAVAKAYMKQYRFAEAETFFREAIELADHCIFDNVCYLLAESHRFLITVLIVQEKYEEALNALQKAKEMIQKFEKIKQEEIGYVDQTERIFLYSLYVELYLTMKDYDKAEYYYNLMSVILRSFDEDDTMFHGEFFLLRAKILEVRERYAEALEWAEKSYKLLLARGEVPLDLCDVLALKARLFIRLGRGEEGIALYNSMQKITSDFRNTEFNAQLDELRTIYEVDRINAEKRRAQLHMLYVLGGCLFIFILFVCYVYYHRLILKKNRALVLQIKKQRLLRKELDLLQYHCETFTQKETSAVKENRTGAITKELPGSEQQRRLVACLREYLLSNENYSNPNIDREELLVALSTNRTYLYEAVKMVTGKTLQEYTYSIQLEIAKQMLENHPEYKIEAISPLCGFGSVRTFYRIFKEHYDMSPAEYRKIALQKD